MVKNAILDHSISLLRQRNPKSGKNSRPPTDTTSVQLPVRISPTFYPSFMQVDP
jgi:hypothetical protein